MRVSADLDELEWAARALSADRSSLEHLPLLSAPSAVPAIAATRRFDQAFDEDRSVTRREDNRRRTTLVIAAAGLTLLLTSGCSAVLSNRVTAESVVGEWTAVDEAPDSDALGASVTLQEDGVAVGRSLPPRALDLGRSTGAVDFVGRWTIVRGSHPLDFAHVVITGRATTGRRTLDASLELLIDSGPPTLLSVWLDKADFTRKLTFARTAPG